MIVSRGDWNGWWRVQRLIVCLGFGVWVLFYFMLYTLSLFFPGHFLTIQRYHLLGVSGMRVEWVFGGSARLATARKAMHGKGTTYYFHLPWDIAQSSFRVYLYDIISLPSNLPTTMFTHIDCQLLFPRWSTVLHCWSAVGMVQENMCGACFLLILVYRMDPKHLLIQHQFFSSTFTV